MIIKDERVLDKNLKKQRQLKNVGIIGKTGIQKKNIFNDEEKPKTTKKTTKKRTTKKQAEETK